MVEFFKKLGKGILYVLIFPAFIVVITCFAIYGIGLFIFLLIKSIFLFFTGRSLYKDLPEDKKAKAILATYNNSNINTSNDFSDNNSSLVNESNIQESNTNSTNDIHINSQNDLDNDSNNIISYDYNLQEKDENKNPNDGGNNV